MGSGRKFFIVFLGRSSILNCSHDVVTILYMQVTKRVDTNDGDWEGWDWRSEDDEMVNGAYFVTSGQGLGSQYAKDSGAQPKSAAMIDQLTYTAGVLGGPR